MSYAAFKMMHWPTGIENCASGFITHSAAELAVKVPPLHSDDLESDWPVVRRVGPVPNLVVTAGNVLEIYLVRVQEDDSRQPRASSEPLRGGGSVMEGISGARLELVCHYWLHGNVESMAVLSLSGDDCRRRDAIALAFKDSKVSVVEYDDSIHGLVTSSMHCFEGPEWNHLKRGRESFCLGPLVKADPQGRCAGVLVYGLQMIILKATQIGHGIVADDEANGTRGTFSISIESSYTINLQELDIKHVKDFTFVHGYIEPVIVVLHEMELTWAGRLSWKHHTCMVSAHSINTSLKQHPLIWSASNLPHDAYKLLAVPSPIGGILVICANSVHYHSQSSSCVLSLNNFFSPVDGSSDVESSSFSVELDAANMAWLSHDVVLFSTKSGELLLLTLCFDGRVVYKLDLSMSKASALTSGIATIGNNFFFLASRLGDSLLVQYSSEMLAANSTHEEDEVADVDGDGPQAKRFRRSDSVQDTITMEELSLHSLVSNTSDSVQKNYSFAVRDSLINVGPLKDFSYGLRFNADSNATGISKQSNYELVCCSGHGKNGAICILQQSIRPELITKVELPGCQGIWTVYHKSSRSHLSDSSKVMNEDDEYHAYLIISLESRTMVLETGELLGEVTESVDYYVQGCTIAAGNLFGRRRVVQVFSRGARILDGSYMTQELLFGTSEAPSNSENLVVVSVSIADPYILLKMSDGKMQLLVGDPSLCTVSVNIPTLVTSSTESISACTLYHDKGPDPWLRRASTDAWLSTGIADIDGSDGSMHDHGDIYCVVCYENGTLEIFDVPSFKCVYTVKGFISGKRYLIDACINEPFKEGHISKLTSEETNGSVKNEHVESMRIVELTMQRWTGLHNRPFLFGILNDGTILCYHAFLYDAPENSVKIENSTPQDSIDSNNLPTSRLRNLRFLRVSLDMLSREDSSDAVPSQRIAVFENVCGYQGLFLSGSRPTWLMVCRERLRAHPQLCDGSVVAFTVLHNINCNHGLIYVTSQGFLKICQLPSSLNYDNYWPVQKVPLRGTPHQVTYYSEKNLYPIIVSSPVERPLNQVMSSLTEQDPGHQFELDGSSSDTQQKYSIEKFEIRVLEREQAGGHWETRATLPMHVSEHALTVRMVTLSNSTTLENEILLAIGSAYVQGEDVAGRGRILLYSIGRNAENSQDLMSEVYSKEFKGAISALASLQGHLLVASGPKITLYKWTGIELNGVAFYDAPPLHAVSMNTVKNFILLGDIHKSIYFLNWKEQGAQLSLLAKDFGALDCYATEFLIDGSTLSLVVSDDQKNIQIFYYAPKMTESWKGQKLLSRAEFHAGAHITKFLRLQMLPTSADQTTPTTLSEKTNRFGLIFAALDGSIGCIAPLDELTFRRLQTLHKRLVDAVPHVCGLNPRSFRQFRSNGKAHRPGPDHIIDCELLHHYGMLSLEEQLEIAQQIGTTRAQILSNLNDLSMATSFL